MLRRSVFAAVVLTVICGGLSVALTTRPLEETPRADAKAPVAPPRVLPGVQPTGELRLPNQWSLRPTGKHLNVGDYPVNIAMHPGGDYLAILHAGFSEHEIVVVDLRNRKQRISCRVPLEQTFYGICFSPDGHTL